MNYEYDAIVVIVDTDFTSNYADDEGNTQCCWWLIITTIIYRSTVSQ